MLLLISYLRLSMRPSFTISPNLFFRSGCSMRPSLALDCLERMRFAPTHHAGQHLAATCSLWVLPMIERSCLANESLLPPSIPLEDCTAGQATWKGQPFTRECGKVRLQQRFYGLCGHFGLTADGGCDPLFHGNSLPANSNTGRWRCLRWPVVCPD